MPPDSIASAAALSAPRLLPNKLSPPAADPHQVFRDAVTRSILEGASARLILVRAPAGFGKTTVMAQSRQCFEQVDIATAWLTMDAADNDPSRFLAYLNAALEDLLPEEGRSATPAQPPALGEFALALMERVSGIAFPFALFLDEFELVQSPTVLALVGEMLDRLPAGGRLVIGSRSLPNLRLGRLRAGGRLLEIDAQRLRFSLEETRSFFRVRRAPGLGSDDLAMLHRKTEGWVAALWLAGLALERHEQRGDFIARFSGTDAGVAEYLAEEVLAQQSTTVRSLLLRTSILREISVPLCNALMPDLDSDAMLRQLASANAFLIPIENRPGSWRYHSLFASFLRGQLQRELPEVMAGLHQAAAGWFASQGRTVPAIDHLIESGDAAQAVQLLAREALPLLTQGRLRLLTRWFDALPSSALKASPLLQATYVWAVCFTRGPQAAMALMQATGIEQSQEPEVRSHVAALQATLLTHLDRWEEAYAAGKRGLPLLPGLSAYADTALVNTVANACTSLGLFPESRRLLDMARQSQGQSASAFHRMYSETIEGIIDLLEGRLRQAQARFRLAVQTTQTSSLGATHGNAWAGLLYAASVYEDNDLEQAARLLQVYLPLARDVWLPDHIILGHSMLSRIAFSQGEIDQAFQTLSELEYLGHERQMPRLAAAARLERARLLLLQGHAGAAAAELQRADNVDLWRSVASRRHFAHDWEDHQIGHFRWQLAAGDAGKAASGLAALLAQAERAAHTRRAMKLRLLHAMALARCGDDEGAEAALLRLLRQACGEGAIRLFVDEGPGAGALVARVFGRQSDGRAEPIFADYLQRLCKAFGVLAVDELATTTLAAPELSEPLTRKEVRLLQLLAEGYSNRALGEKLFVSDSTVRTHLRSINGKLGANSRTHAVAIARRAGIVS
ncbi:MAG TPA: LuxR C-terminal-related transcriptional regulator [Burkholderiaceae bacterium]|nr:LuxR C-terminal-related transcriptional regulator [Burkholderiaceae bacterium]